jgi:hypothetical protein
MVRGQYLQYRKIHRRTITDVVSAIMNSGSLPHVEVHENVSDF